MALARPAADGSWRLSGDKWFCSNPDAGFAMLLARSEPAESKKGRGRTSASERRVAEPRDDYRQMNPEQIGAVLARLRVQPGKPRTTDPEKQTGQKACGKGASVSFAAGKACTQTVLGGA